jgi:hypothetical protein
VLDGVGQVHVAAVDAGALECAASRRLSSVGWAGIGGDAMGFSPPARAGAYRFDGPRV